MQRGSCAAQAAAHFRLTLVMKREPHGGPIYCKMETPGKYAQIKTVKLSAGCTYRFDVSFRPPQVLQQMTIGGKDVEAVERARDRNASAYSAYHSTKDKEPSKRGEREELPIYMCVLDSGELIIRLQIKYYRADDQSHCEWGSRLHCIELDCSSVEGSLVMVDREMYQKINSTT
ncbi:CB1 cannabinoid receptor-interacting protein 1-like [Trichogramma pretiosum]|uniref:CB1 cannabinoid receptor-interacting protein 1-like n=1 Tax=Trichogramma pretiosum TaxID=7493 RepID=UPI0006C9D4D8|nr:CB1 cannabinoid receptor-interacting protein 1-like [Trichogramma pretiosum]